MEILTTREIENFGRNLRFVPQVYYEPSSEAELVQILKRHAGQKIKAIGSMHSWSSAAECAGVVVSLRLFDEVRLVADTTDGSSAWVGGGIQMKHLLTKLGKFGKTLPSLGLITEQTIVGAISTGTHGSGRHCLSHYVQAVRIVRYEAASGQPIVEEINSGDALRAAQCALGNLGIIVAVKIACRDRFHIAEVWRTYDSLEAVLQSESTYPLQQFFLIPWKWSYLAQHRQETALPSSKLHWLYRVYFFLAIDIGLHLVILAVGRLLNSKRWVQAAFRKWLWRSIITNWKVIGESSKMLVMEHELFRHIETELLVTRDQLPATLEFVQRSLSWAAGDGADLPDDYVRQVVSAGLTQEYQVARSAYCHHYPICVRRILPDSSLISMSSGGSQDWYSISMISYHSIHRREGFRKAMCFIARSAALLFGARPHWGKYNPLTANELEQLYPELAKFKQVCLQLDSQDAFRNHWFAEILQSVEKH
jgi:FAD/FMN-containing dehydrogenase